MSRPLKFIAHGLGYSDKKYENVNSPKKYVMFFSSAVTKNKKWEPIRYTTDLINHINDYNMLDLNN